MPVLQQDDWRCLPDDCALKAMLGTAVAQLDRAGSPTQDVDYLWMVDNRLTKSSAAT